MGSGGASQDSDGGQGGMSFPSGLAGGAGGTGGGVGGFGGGGGGGSADEAYLTGGGGGGGYSGGDGGGYPNSGGGGGGSYDTGLSNADLILMAGENAGDGSISITLVQDTATPVPEPISLALLGTGLLAGLISRRRRNQESPD